MKKRNSRYEKHCTSINFLVKIEGLFLRQDSNLHSCIPGVLYIDMAAVDIH